MNKIIPSLLLAVLCLATTDAMARGGFSSGGGRGGFSSSSRSFSSSRSTFSSPSRSYGTVTRSYSAPTRTVTRSTTVTRSFGRSPYFGGRYYGGYHYGYGLGWHPYAFGGPFGMGYMYSNGLMEGIIIGSLMHPAGTTVYSGPGYSQPALLYPDGAVVNQQGYQVGTYANGQFAPMANGPLLAQEAPSRDDAASVPQAQAVQPTPVIIQQQSAGWSDGQIAVAIILAIFVFFVFLAVIF